MTDSNKDIVANEEPSPELIDEEEAVPEANMEFLTNICILPPTLSKTVSKEQIAKDAVLLPPIMSSEAVLAIRAALSEIKQFAHITNYRLIVEELDESLLELIIKEQNRNDSSPPEIVKKIKGKKKKKKKTSVSNDIVSLYTCDQNVVQISSKTKEPQDEIVLNEFELLTALVEEGKLGSNMALRMVLEYYDEASLKDHLYKTKSLLDGNPPYLLSLTNADDINAQTEEGGEEKVDQSQVEANPEQKEETQDESKEKEKQEEEKEEGKIDPLELIIPAFPITEPVEIDGKNIQDFYFLAAGEEERLAIAKSDDYVTQSIDIKDKNDDGKIENRPLSQASKAHDVGKKLVELQKKCSIPCSIVYSGFNPPPAHRRMLGDVSYLQITLPRGEGTVHVTVIPSGFYVNKSSGSNDDAKFDPSPSLQPCYSHTLLDCLLQKSPSLRLAWSESLAAAQEKNELSPHENPLEAFFLSATQYAYDNNDANGFALDAATLRPSWLVPPNAFKKSKDEKHKYSLWRTEDVLSDTFGVDLRSGAQRDWNEDLQVARELPRDTIDQRIERARQIYKSLSEFADASVTGVMAIFKGHIMPMNPNENIKAHVYLHNNIFFSKVADTGIDTFKLGKGDACAVKTAARDANCVGMLHKLDLDGMHTLATVLVDYLGTRFLCQSIVPGILLGDKTHKVLHGAVEATSPLSWDKDVHEMLENNLSKPLMIASRKTLKSPLLQEEKSDDEEVIDDFFGSLEMKCILGSDKRKYFLDLTRLTPRDANWIPSNSGGTGNYEKNVAKNLSFALDDDEWFAHVLRPELVLRFTNKKMNDLRASKEANKDSEKSRDEDEAEMKKKEVEGNLEYLRSLRMNLNVFVPNMKNSSFNSNDIEQLEKDEELAREAASYLWDTILPQITREVRENPNTIPMDGKGLTEYLHERGVNCRYLGRIATLAKEQEEQDIQEEKDLIAGKRKDLPRRSMPLCWLEMLECEIISRAAKHVLGKYLAESGAFTLSKISNTVGSFLSALFSCGEESAAETERRMEKDGNNSSEDQGEETLFTGASSMTTTRNRADIWKDINNEIERRFGYSLHLYNNTKDPTTAMRTPLVPLLRRVCQRTGIRLHAKNYELGGKGLCTPGSSFPIAPSDVYDILPLVKHAANDGSESFVPSNNGADAANAHLHICLPDAKTAFEGANMLTNEQSFNHALTYVQEATNLYQRVTETPLHSRVAKCFDLTALILFQAKDFELSAAHAEKALAVSMQINGVDCAEAAVARRVLSHILLNGGKLASAMKNSRAAAYLTQVLAGSHHAELSTSYQKFSSIYSDIGNILVSLRFLQAAIRRKNSDRVVQAVLNRQMAQIYATIGEIGAAAEVEKQSFHIFRVTLGDEHEYTKQSKETLQAYMVAAQNQNKIIKEQQEKQIAEAQADAIADEIVAEEIAEEIAEEERKKKKKKKKSKSKSKKK